MSEVKSAWDRFPGYRIDLVPCRATARVSHAGLLVAQSDACLIVEESDHEAQLYIPEADVRWDLFEPTDLHTVCPFKGEADYWTLTASDPPEENVVWTYRRPFEEVAGLEGYVAFYSDRLQLELEENWSGEPDHSVTTGFPTWGDAEDLARLIDVRPAGDGRFVSAPYPDPPIGSFLPIPEERRRRSVIEGGHLLGQAIVAASKTVPGQRVTSASMIFSKAANFDEPLEIDVEVLRGGRTFSTIEVRTSQGEQLRAVGLLLMDVTTADRIRGVVSMPDVAGPRDSEPLDMSVTGRELRIVDGAYTQDLEHLGPPELYAWIRFRDAPREQYLHAALLAQATTHWTIAAAMRPHPGISEALAHITLSTGIMTTDIAFHDDVDVSEWMLYANPAVYAGRGQVQGQGQVFAEDGRLLATYSVQGMIRDFATDPASMKKGYESNSM